MRLTNDEAKLFYNLFEPLALYVNDKYSITPQPLSEEGEYITVESMSQIMDCLWKNTGCIDEYVLEYKDGMSFSDVEIVLSWKNAVSGLFSIVDSVDGYLIFMDDYNAYAVSGIKNEVPFSDNNDRFPIPVKATLIPFKGKIIYDTIIKELPVYWGPNMFGAIERAYLKVKEENLIIWTADDFIKRSKVIRLFRESGGKEELEPERLIRLSEEDDDDLAENNDGSITSDKENDPDDIRESTIKDLINEYFNEEKIKEIFMKTPDYFCKNVKIAIKSEPIYDLEKILAACPVKKLKRDAEYLRVKSVTTYKKDDLVAILMDLLCDMDVMYDTFLFFNDEEIEFFKKILKKKVYSINGASLFDQIGSILKLMPFISIFYHNSEYHIVISDEVRRVYSALKKTDFSIRRDTYMTINALAGAASHLYGALSIEELVKIVKAHNRTSTDNNEEVYNSIRQVLYDLQYGADSEFEIYKENLVSTAIMEDDDFEIWIEDILDGRAKRPMKIIPPEDMINYCDFRNVEMTEDHKRLLTFLKKNIPEGKDESFAIQFFEDLNISFRYDESITTIMEEINEAGYIFDIDKMNVMLGLVMAARNNTRIWGLNGWTPTELSKNEAPKWKDAAEKTKESGMAPWMPDDFIEPVRTPYINVSPKIGRNDPCPCGSGKKYKNCCLLKEN